MKNFILGVLTCALLSFTSIETGIITVKPALPKSTVSFYSERCSYGAKNLSTQISTYISKGYIVKSVTGTDCTYFVVMEKY